MFSHMTTGLRHLSDTQLKAYFKQNAEQRAKVEKALKALDFEEEQDARQTTFAAVPTEDEDQTHFRFSEDKQGGAF